MPQGDKNNNDEFSILMAIKVTILPLPK